MTMHNQVGPPDKSSVELESFGDGAGGKKTLTSSWVKGEPVRVMRYSTIGLSIDYTKGSETTARLRVMVAKNDPATGTVPGDTSALWRPSGELGAASSGVRDLTKGQISLTPANFDANDAVTTILEIAAWDWVRVDAEYVGGSNPGSVYVAVAGGWGL